VSIGTFLPANTTSATIRFRSVSDYSIESLMPVASLTAVEWIAGDGVSNVINLASLGRLDITGSRGGARGDLEASVQVFGSGRVSSFQVNGLFNEGALFTNGDIGAITLGGINSSVISAGALEVIPADELANVASFRIKGIAGFAGNLFTHSLVVAERFGSIVVQKVDPGGASVRGFVADEIGSYHRIGGPRLSNLDDPTDFTPGGQVDLVGQYLVRIV
jgi:hypothetical protein